MHESLLLYDQALALLEQEAQALEDGREEDLPLLCQKRVAILERAWDKRYGCPEQALRQRLEALKTRQEHLTARAVSQQASLRMVLHDSRQQSTRLAGYGKVAGHGLGRSLLYKTS